jgi:cytochrome bd-type quinol oxidase subunit 2
VTGTFDDTTVRAAFDSAAGWSAAAVVVVILVCYIATRKSSGPRFDRRWLFSGIVAVVLCGIASYASLHFANTTAMAQSCGSDPNAFPWPLPGSVVSNRTVAGLLWGALAFIVGSIVFTAAFGWYPSMKNGFYHNRGTPWPRMLTGGK